MVVALIPELVVGRLDPHVVVQERHVWRQSLVHRRNHLEVDDLVAEIEVRCRDHIAKHLGDPLDAVDDVLVVVPLDWPLVRALPVSPDVFRVLEPQRRNLFEVFAVDDNRHCDRVVALAHALAVVLCDLPLDAFLVLEGVVPRGSHGHALLDLVVHLRDVSAVRVHDDDHVLLHLGGLQPVRDCERLVVRDVVVDGVVVLRRYVRRYLLHKMVADRVGVGVRRPRSPHRQQPRDRARHSHLFVPEDRVAALPLEVLFALYVEHRVVRHQRVRVLVNAGADPLSIIAAAAAVGGEVVDVIVE
mmetsp:Transcript_46832/g.111070  ORF Transcript_46832/g.111070 Transcript_46832/m.111070 type:complete len:301 (-) Transcript_46832:1168-2070(-)